VDAHPHAALALVSLEHYRRLPVSYADAPYIWIWLHTEGTPPTIGKPWRSNGRTVVQVNFVLQGHYVAVQPGVRGLCSPASTRTQTASGMDRLTDKAVLQIWPRK
jgi:hypothetical protein